MSDNRFVVMGMLRRIDDNNKVRLSMKYGAAIAVIVGFICTFDRRNDIFIVGCLTMVAVCVCFGVEVYYLKKNKEIEFQIYDWEVEDQRAKREVSELTGQIFPDDVLKREIKEPSEEVVYPYRYYVAVLVLLIIVIAFEVSVRKSYW